MASIMCFMILVFVLLSYFFIAIELDHDCCGEDCHICECMEMCFNTVRRLADGAIRFFAVSLPVLVVTFVSVFLVRLFEEETLVSAKIRMND